MQTVTTYTLLTNVSIRNLCWTHNLLILNTSIGHEDKNVQCVTELIYYRLFNSG
jgi:hypothetical protein